MASSVERSAIEVIVGSFYSDRLYWISAKAPPKNLPNLLYFCIDTVKLTQELSYAPFAYDFGPLNLAMTYKFCTELDKLLKSTVVEKHKVFHYCATRPDKRANAAYLMGAFQILVLNRTAAEAWAPFTFIDPFPAFVDASLGGCSYSCTILHCLLALETAVRLQWFDLHKFNVTEYEFNERVENGDFNWIIPGKILAFSNPSREPIDADGMRAFTPEDYVPVFKKIGVTAVVRLNKKTYDANRFTVLGLHHYDLYFLDGSVPEVELVQRFLSIVETEEGAVAVHCKAGLGRTGTLIACYAMKHFTFPPAELIAWIRICRPGSILGPQQQFLHQMYKKCVLWGEEYAETHECRPSPTHSSELEEFKVNLTPEESDQALNGDLGQAERLINAKKVQHLPTILDETTTREETKEVSSSVDR